MPKISSVVASALLAYAATTADGFTPSSLMIGTSSSASSSASAAQSSNTALHVSVVSYFLTREEAEKKIANVFEFETPESVGIAQVTKKSSNNKNKRRNKARSNNRRKHNYSANQAFRHQQPDTDFYTLHSSAVSHLQKDMPIQDIT